MQDPKQQIATEVQVAPPEGSTLTDLEMGWEVAIGGAIVLLLLAVLRGATRLVPMFMEGVGKIWNAYVNARVAELEERATEAPDGVDPIEHARKTVNAPQSVKDTWSMAKVRERDSKAPPHE